MASRETGKRQHLVPQQMIRRFAGEDGKLVEMVKPELRVGTRRRAPSGILFQDDFYKDCVSDFDAELLTPVEQKFAAVYDEVLANHKLDGHQGAALVDWIAAMLARTRLVSALMPFTPASLPDEVASHLTELSSVLANIARAQWYTMFQNLLVRERWNWRWRRFPPQAGEIVITDHPVCTTSIVNEGGIMVIVPLSRDTALFGGGDEAINRMRRAQVADLNFFLSAWAHRHIFAGRAETLEKVRASLSEGSAYQAITVAEARRPLFGFPERMQQRTRSGELPSDFDFGGALDEIHASYGRPRWEADQSE